LRDNQKKNKRNQVLEKNKALYARKDTKDVEDALKTQYKTGRLYAKITSRPGQCGRVDGYILEGEELAFYQKKIAERKNKTK